LNGALISIKTRRFPPPSSVEELDARCFIVKDGLCVTPVTETIAVRE
jgi:hypothetical protein